MSENQTTVLRLVWQAPEDLPSVYANQVYVTHSTGEFYVVFGEVQLPPVGAELPTDIPVRPVAKLVMSPRMMEQVVKALSTNWKNFQEGRRGDLNPYEPTDTEKP